MATFILRRIKDGQILQYGSQYSLQIQDMLKTSKFELLSTLDKDSEPKAFKNVPVVEDELECPLCGKVAANDQELLAHKEEHYGKPKTEQVESKPKRGRPKKT